MWLLKYGCQKKKKVNKIKPEYYPQSQKYISNIKTPSYDGQYSSIYIISRSDIKNVEERLMMILKAIVICCIPASFNL